MCFKKIIQIKNIGKFTNISLKYEHKQFTYDSTKVLHLHFNNGNTLAQTAQNKSVSHFYPPKKFWIENP